MGPRIQIFANLPHPDVAFGVVDNSHVSGHSRAADAVGVGEIVGAAVGDDGAGGFRQAIAVAGGSLGLELLADGADQVGRHRRAAGGDADQRVHRRAGATRLLQKLPDHDRHPGHAGQPVRFNQSHRLQRSPFVHQRQLRAQSRVDVEAAESADVEERERLQRAGLRSRRVGGGWQASDGTGHRAPQHRIHQVGDVVAMGGHRPLRIAGGSRGVEDGGEVGWPDIGLRQFREWAGYGVGEVFAAIARAAPTRNQHQLQIQLGKQVFEPLQALAVDEQRRRRRVADRERQLSAGPPGIQRDGDRADGVAGPPADAPLWVVAHADRDPIALADASAAQALGQGGHLSEVLTVSENFVFVDQEGSIAVIQRGDQDFA